MDDLNELKTLWRTAKTDSLPTSSEMVQFAKKFRNRKLLNKIVLIAAACLLGILMIVIIIVNQSALITTTIGEILMVLACILLSATNIKSIKRFYKLSDCSNKAFLQFIEQTRQNQIRYYKKTQFIGLLFSSVGLLLLLYEPVYQHLILSIAVYTLAIVYLILIWFVIRPKKFKKGIAKLEETRARLEKILNQLN